MARAIHGFERVNALFLGMFFIHLGDEHVFAEFVPMAGFFPKFSVDHLGCFDLDITRLIKTPAHVCLERAVDHPAMGVPEDHAWRLILQMEQPHLPTQSAMVTFFRFFQAMKMGLQFLFRAPGRAINTLKLGVVGVTAPIGTCQLHQFEGMANTARGKQMGPAAQI